MRTHKLGIYEKALPKHLSWQDRLSTAKACGFDFVEISIDETDERLSRLDWSKQLSKQLSTLGLQYRLCAFQGIDVFPLVLMMKKQDKKLMKLWKRLFN